MEASKNSFVHKLFFTPTSRSSNGALQPLKRKKLVQMTAACKFRQQLSSLIDKLEKTGTSFVRCIKPNQEMKPAVFDAPLILDQLKRDSRRERPSPDLYDSYSKLLPDRLARLDPRLFCRSLFYALGLKEADFQFGLTRVFFRSGKFAEFDQLLKQDPARLEAAQYGAWSVIKLKKKIEYLHANATIIQAAYRGHRQRLKTRALLKQQRERRERERKERERKAAALLAEQRELERRRAEAAEVERKAAALRLQAEESSPVGRDVRQPPAASSTRPQMVDQATQSTAPEESSFALWTFNALRDLVSYAV
ncbi:Myosin heavy chain 95F-like [Aphelenchoides fujianensis]|nr:Myosin heavy chain 95F-like [Aphelenchoides fujianensis]